MTEHEKTQDTSASAGTPPNPHAASVLKLADAMFRGSVWFAVATVVVGMVVSGVLVGQSGVFGALVGGAVACASSLATLLLMRNTAALNPYFVMAAALGGFMGKMLVLLIVMLLLRDVDALHPKALAFTMLATVIVSAATEAVAFRRVKIPTIIPSSDR
jgi:ATP synthase protein I